MTLSVTAPIGGFGNHTRWLALLDDQFTLDLQEISWPPPDPDQRMLLPSRKIVTLGDKVAFIKNYIYSPARSWHNWLILEWYHRPRLEPVISFNHNTYDQVLEDCKDLKNKMLVLKINPKLASRCYLKLNSNFNNTTQDLFERLIEYNNLHLDKLPLQPNLLILDSDVLYNHNLNKEFYQAVIKFFGLEDRYKIANELHQLWYQAHVRAETEFVNDVTKFYLTGYNK